jgi:NAD(P)H-dependent FMN reductase
MKILAISGSLRVTSSNTAVVNAVKALAPAGVEVAVFGGLADLPPFNPDDDGETVPTPVVDLRSRVEGADAVLISSPEYAHGVPGVLKNALDWLVGGAEIVGKPVALINAAPRATHAHASLTETLAVMSARVIQAASITVGLTGRNLDASGIVADAELSSALRSAIVALVRASESHDEAA